MLGPNTVRALNGQKVAERKRPVAAEQDRHDHRQHGALALVSARPRRPHVIVNIPDYTLTLYDHGKVYWNTKIVAGKPGKTRRR